MKYPNKTQFLSTTLLASALLSPSSATALDQIIRPYWSPRSAAMGGVRITTGLYDENFFNNPARVTANPKFRFTLFDPMVEASSNLPDTIKSVTGSGDVVQKLGDQVGKNNHGRLQTTFPAIYFAPGEEGKWGFAFAMITNTQFDIAARSNFSVVPQGTLDMGPAFTVGRRFLEENRLSVGATSHFVYRFQTTRAFSFLDFLQGTSLAPSGSAAQGAMINFDLGATYRLPVGEGSPFRYSVGAALNNLLGDGYDDVSLDLVPGISCSAAGAECSPNGQPRTLGLGLSATRQSWWKLTDTVFALELTDIGNNKYGSLYRLVHLGAETHLSVLALRLGVNQGYLSAGLGLDLRFFTLDLTTYGEELTLNPGGFEDRRYALKIALQI